MNGRWTQQEDEKQPKRGRLLVVEDDPAVITMLRDYYRHLGYQVTVFETVDPHSKLGAVDPDTVPIRSFAEFKSKLAELNPDAVLTDRDLGWATFNGDDVVNHVKTALPGRPLVMQTGSADRPQAYDGYTLMPKTRPLDKAIDAILSGTPAAAALRSA